MMIDPFDMDAEKTFTCIKCKNEFEYDEFFKHDDPTFDYTFYIVSGDVEAIGVEIVDGMILCRWCVPDMNREKP